MAADLPAIAALLLIDHPVTGAYGLDDAVVAGQMNALNLAGPPDFDAMRDLALTSAVNNRIVWGALAYVAKLAIGDVLSPDGSTPPHRWPGPAGNLTVNDDHVCSAAAMMALLEHGTQIPLNDGLFIKLLDDLDDVDRAGAGADGCFCMTTTTRLAFEALSQNVQSHAQQNGITDVKEADVTAARLI